MNNSRQNREDDALLSAYVDGELGPQEADAVEKRLAEDERARLLVEQLRRMKEITGAMRIKDPPREEGERFWQVLSNRVERSLGWLLFATGGLVVLAWAALSLINAIWNSTALPALVRWGSVAAVAGVVVLLVSVVRERWHVRRTTRYKDIAR